MKPEEAQVLFHYLLFQKNNQNMQAQIETIVSTWVQLNSKKNKMDQTQHTHLKAQSRHRLDRNQLLQSSLAQPLIHSDTDKFTGPATTCEISWKIGIKFRIVQGSRTHGTCSRAGRSGVSWEKASDTQEVVISLFLIYLQENTESWPLTLQGTNGTLTSQKW